MIVRDAMEHARQWSREKGVWHHAVIDYADRLGFLGLGRPVIFELVSTGLRVRPYDPTEPWQRTRIADVDGARRRLQGVLEMEERQQYKLLSNNCEHVARYIAFGEFRSEQIRTVLTVCAVVGLVVWASKQE